MLEINVNIKCPDLLLAATAIATVLKPGKETTVPPQHASAVMPAAPAPAPVAPAMSAAPAASVASAPAPVAPTAPAPSITLAQVSKAGADLISMNPAKMPELMGLLQQFGAPAITELKPEQIGAFATALRALGGKI